MKSILKFLFVLFFGMTNIIYAQRVDSLNIRMGAKKKFYERGLFKSSICPTLLIGWGVSTIHCHGLYSSNDAYKLFHKLNINHTQADNYLQYFPFAELAVLYALNVKRRDDLINSGILIIKSGIVMGIAVEGLKHLTHEIRPDSLSGSDKTQSFPSGHTALAFTGATIVYKEFKDKSIWYGIGAYTVASSVGILRMVNDKHWESDVFVGAGLGILSVNLVYLTHKYRWGKKANTLLVPSYSKGSLGLYFRKKF